MIYAITTLLFTKQEQDGVILFFRLVKTNYEQMRLEICKNLRTASLNPKITGYSKKSVAQKSEEYVIESGRHASIAPS